MDAATKELVQKMIDDSTSELKTKLDASEAENKTLKEQVAKEADIRITNQFEQQAKDEFSNLGDAKEIGAVLKEASEKGEAHLKSVEKILKAAENKLEAGAIFGELGSSQGGLTADLDSKVKVAKEAIMKENTKLTDEQAEAMVFEQNPALYDEYLNANPRQTGGH